MLIGKVVITCFSCFVTYLWLENGYADGTGPSSPVLPVAFTAVLAYFVACTFMQVYEISIDTILICFCEDKKNNDGEQNLYFMTTRCAGWLGSQASAWSVMMMAMATVMWRWSRCRTAVTATMMTAHLVTSLHLTSVQAATS